MDSVEDFNGSSSKSSDVDLMELIKSGQGFLDDWDDDTLELDDAGMIDEHVNLDDPLFGDDHELKKYLDNGNNSLVFNTPILRDVQKTSSFNSLFQNTTAVTKDGNVKKVVLKKGNGVKPKQGTQIWIHYVMYAEKDKPMRIPFDSTRERQHMDTFLLNGEKIPCMNLALDTMEYQEVSLFISSSWYAFGPLGCIPRIPADTNILFIIELVELDISNGPTPVFRMSAEGRQGLEFQKILDDVLAMNAVGNMHFRKQAYEDALRIYEMGIDILVNYVPVFPADRKEKKRQLYKIYCNQVATFLELEQPHRACETFEEVLGQQIPMFNGKLLYRHAKGLWEQGKYAEALEALDHSLSIEPGHEEILEFRCKLISKIQAEEKEGDALAKKMGQVFFISVENPEAAATSNGKETKTGTKSEFNTASNSILTEAQFSAGSVLDVRTHKKSHFNFP